MSLADCFAAALAKRGKVGDIHRRSRVQDGGARNQSRLVIGASCGSQERRNTQSRPFCLPRSLRTVPQNLRLIRRRKENSWCLIDPCNRSRNRSSLSPTNSSLKPIWRRRGKTALGGRGDMRNGSGYCNVNPSLESNSVAWIDSIGCFVPGRLFCSGRTELLG